MWYQGLVHAKDIHEQGAVRRAFSEWADDDAIASHVAYGLDIFCTEDFGRSNPSGSVFDDENRAWLASTYGVRFMTLKELVKALSAEYQAA